MELRARRSANAQCVAPRRSARPAFGAHGTSGPRAGGARRPRPVAARAAGGGGGEGKQSWWQELFDFGSWAPRSTRIWRLQQYDPPAASQPEEGGGGGAAADEAGPDAMAVLSDRISQLRGSSPSGGGGGAALAEPPGSSGEGPELAQRSFSDADDGELSAALGDRIRQIATTTGEWGDSMDEEEMRQPLSGEEIRSLLLSKYGKQYDLSFVRRQLPGMKTFVSLNIMWLHLEQQSFRMSGAQYAEKLDSVAALVNALGQTDKVRAFLKAPAKSQKGLPRRPVVGTAISIQLDLQPAQIEEWFGRGYE